MSSRKSIRDLLLLNTDSHPVDLVSYVAGERQVSRQAVHQELKKLIAANLIKTSGSGRKLRYALAPIVSIERTISIGPGAEEHIIWRQVCEEALAGLPRNVREICYYGFGEIVNNAIDHSGSADATISIVETAASVSIKVMDRGIGIFRKICSQFQFADEHDAILELAKGKLTTDPVRHSGQGIFFTSRIFEYFSLSSGSVSFRHIEPEDDWIIEDRSVSIVGTEVVMRTSLQSSVTLKEIFDKYAQDHEEYAFDTTDIPVALMMRGEEYLVSRSQARRLLARLDTFKDVTLDFKGVDSIGQAFADEVFRVYAKANSEIRLRAANASVDVARMIRRAAPGTEVTGARRGGHGNAPV